MIQLLAGKVIESVVGTFTDRSERKTAKRKHDLSVAKAQADAKIARMESAQQADIAWENLSVENAGWKDEWFTILLSIPMVLCFVPGMAEYVSAGFEALTVNTPEWYQWAFLTAVGSSFGVKKFTDVMKLKKGA